jgi:hypothetical protein
MGLSPKHLYLSMVLLRGGESQDCGVDQNNPGEKIGENWKIGKYQQKS